MKLWQKTLALLVLPYSLNGFAGLPTTSDSALKKVSEYGFFFSSKNINFLISTSSSDIGVVVLDDDLNVHYATCAESENEPKLSEQKLDWESVRLDEVKSPQTVNLALFGTDKPALLKDVLLGLKKGDTALMRLSQNRDLIECHGLETFTQQELMSVGEYMNRESYRAASIAKHVAQGLAYKLALSHYGWEKCVDTEFSPYFRIQEEVHSSEDAVEFCKDQQQLTPINRLEYLYAQSTDGLKSDVNAVRDLVNKIKAEKK